MPANDAVRLRMHSGVPIIDVLGEWAQPAASALSELIGALVSAGHFEIVVNMERAVLSESSVLNVLAKAAQSVRDHFGHIEIVARAEQLDELIRQQAQRVFRLAASEESAIRHIKRVPVLSPGQLHTAEVCQG